MEVAYESGTCTFSAAYARGSSSTAMQRAPSKISSTRSRRTQLLLKVAAAVAAAAVVTCKRLSGAEGVTKMHGFVAEVMTSAQIR